jgi:hypothetical protein
MDGPKRFTPEIQKLKLKKRHKRRMDLKWRRGMPDQFAYTLRFAGDPAFVDRDAMDLKRFAKEARIDDVAYIIAPQDLSTGHLPLAELDKHKSWISEIAKAVAPLGATLSINPWHTLMHCDLGQDIPKFTRMVDAKGQSASVCLCPLDEAWQEFFCASFAHLAELEPHILWVEDDFRFHNHEPLDWGGCFCDAHMELYSRMAGHRLERESFAAGVAAPGKPHPYRKIWLDACRETLEKLADKLGCAIRATSPKTKLGLMSSAPYMHCAEGRHWTRLLSALACGQPMVDRIHLPCYIERTPMEYLRLFNMVSMQSRHFIPADAEIYPELENHPYSLFTKSLSFTRFQMLCALPLNIKGLAMNLFDLNGNGIDHSEGFARMLREIKPFLNRMLANGVFSSPPAGVRIMCCEDSSGTLETEAGKSFLELCPQEVFFAGLLPAMGIPVAYESDSWAKGAIIAVSGQYFRNLSEDQLDSIFASNFVIMNGDALATLVDMGLGRLAGVAGARWMRQNSGEYTYEEAESPAGLIPRRASACILCSDALHVDYLESADVRVLSWLCDAKANRASPAMAMVGGRTLVFPYGHFAGSTDIPAMLLNPLRRDLLQEAISGAMGNVEPFPLIDGTAHLTPYAYRLGAEQAGCRHSEKPGYAIHIVNGSTDTAEGPVFRLADEPHGKARIHPSWGDAFDARFTGCGEGLWRLPISIPAMETALVEWVAK